jgi:hypothetical protein
MMDLGSVHERTAALFTVWLAQYAPAALHGEEDRVIVSRLVVGGGAASGGRLGVYCRNGAPCPQPLSRLPAPPVRTPFGTHNPAPCSL